ncbi:MAG: DUF2281 domain-containing protein [Chloroflexi bacterium]|nr:DUF2281 domain-containing protein [Chloroflexota bacterium]
MYQVELNEADSHLLDLIEAALKGEDVFIRRDKESIVQLVPVPKIKHQPKFGSAKGMIVMADDFDDPLEDFEPYMP